MVGANVLDDRTILCRYLKILRLHRELQNDACGYVTLSHSTQHAITPLPLITYGLAKHPLPPYPSPANTSWYTMPSRHRHGSPTASKRLYLFTCGTPARRGRSHPFRTSFSACKGFHIALGKRHGRTRRLSPPTTLCSAIEGDDHRPSGKVGNCASSFTPEVCYPDLNLPHR